MANINHVACVSVVCLFNRLSIRCALKKAWCLTSCEYKIRSVFHPLIHPALTYTDIFFFTILASMFNQCKQMN